MENVEEEFMESWNQIEHNCSKSSSLPLTLRKNILELIKELRNSGFDKTLRAWSSLYDLVLSRSKEYRLRMEEPCITFCFTDIFSLMNSQKALEELRESELITIEEFQKHFDRKSTDLVKIIISHKGKQEETISEIKYTPQIESLLQWLEKEEID